VERFGLRGLLDTEGTSYAEEGLKYLKLADSELLTRIEKNPKLLRLPLVRAGKRLSLGEDKESWNDILAFVIG